MSVKAVEVCIVGGGPAGLSAALVLGRCRRSVVVFDSGQPRNSASRALHAYLTRDGTPPLDLRRMGRDELRAYPSVEVVEDEVATIRRQVDRFTLETRNGREVTSRFLLLATGRVDVLPEVSRAKEFYGRGLYHCPYCDGWEHRDGRLAVTGSGAVDLALELLTWSDRVLLCPDEDAPLDEPALAHLRQRGVAIAPAPVAGLSGPAGGSLEQLTLKNGDEVPCDALFFCSECRQRSPFGELLGCSFDDAGSVKCTGHAATGVPGLYVAGNVRGGLHLAIMAAAEGAEAAVAINEAILDQDVA